MKRPKLKEHFICYIDILGYEEMIKHLGEQNYLELINDVYKKTYKHWEKSLLLGEVNEKKNIVKSLIKVFSDNIIIAVPRTNDDSSVLLYLLIMIGYFQIELIKMKLLVRGSFTSGMLYINKNYVFGTGLIDAYKLENNISIFPRIIVDRQLVAMLNSELSKILEKDTDGHYFVDYLLFAIDSYGKIAISEIALSEYLQTHKAFIENGILLYNKNKRILQKYLWCREYHNRFCNRVNFKEYIIV